MYVEKQCVNEFFHVHVIVVLAIPLGLLYIYIPLYRGDGYI